VLKEGLGDVQPQGEAFAVIEVGGGVEGEGAPEDPLPPGVLALLQQAAGGEADGDDVLPVTALRRFVVGLPGLAVSLQLAIDGRTASFAGLHETELRSEDPASSAMK